MPSPAVAWAAANRKAVGAVFSASHNPYTDNGIKLFAPGGLKLADEVQNAIESRYLALLSLPGGAGPDERQPGRAVGARRPSAGVDGWVETILASVAPDAFAGVKLVVDCANGAAFSLAPGVFRQLGADVTVIGDQPDGFNINRGFGSTDLGALQDAVTSAEADLGLALDGDADRLIAVDDHGTVVDGDRVLGLLAVDWAARDLLRGRTVAVTVMTNLGFHRAMARHHIDVVTTKVGDRYILEALETNGLSLGGEQSGHVICRELATTGDGVLSGVQLVDVVARAGRPLSDMAAEVLDRVPQILRNVPLPVGTDRSGSIMDGADDDPLGEEIARLEAQFGSNGRILVRSSGTEPLLRIMVVHGDPVIAEQACAQLVDTAERVYRP